MVYKITELLTVLISAVLLFYMYGLEVLVHEQKSEKVSVLLAVIVAVLFMCRKELQCPFVWWL